MRCDACSAPAVTFIYRRKRLSALREEPDGPGYKPFCITHGERFVELMTTVLRDSAYSYIALHTPACQEQARKEVA